MSTQTIIWTALPNGRDANGNYLLSIHVSPRLVPNNPTGTLAEFPDFLDWPSTAFGRITVVFGNGFSTPATIVTNPARDSNRWQDLFSSSTFVRSRAFEDYTQRLVRSYPTERIIQHLHDTYADIAAANPDTFPDMSSVEMQSLIGPLDPEIIEGQRAKIETDIASSKALGGQGVTTSYAFAELQRFHTPPAVIVPGTGPAIPQVDFHDMLSYAQDHAALLRILGLVIDLQLLEPPPPAFTTVRLRIGWNPQISGNVDVFPLTECSVTATGFDAIPLGGELANRYYRLDDPNRFAVAPVDQDGGGLKALNFAAEINRAHSSNLVPNSGYVSNAGGHKSVDTPTSYALPAMRATGLAIFEKDRAVNLRTTKFVRGLNNLNANLLTGSIPGDNVLLFADDLAQGGRWDVMDVNAGVWRSLTARSTQYKFDPNGAPTTVPVSYDEGPSNVAASAAHDNSSNDLHLGEIVTTWDGWSLGAPRPGQFIDPAAQTLQPHTSTADPNGMQLEIAHQVVAGSLPRLRFGRSYRFRARAVDIAGNSLPLADPSNAHATAPITFRRLEPVQSPEIVLRTALLPSDAVDRFVLRSNYNAPPSPQTAERHVLAPKVAQRTCEFHGRFDTNNNPSTVDGSASTYNLIANRESKQVTDLPSAQPDPSGQPDVYFFDVSSLTAPYLPDPVATGLLFRGIGIAPAQNLTAPFGGTWPALDGIRVVARERQNGDPDFFFDASTGRVDVFLDKAERRLVRLSCAPDPNAILEFLLWQWIGDRGLVTPQLQAAVVAGAHWMFTPYRDITFVHAVKQPLQPVVFNAGITGVRNVGETFATFVSSLPATFSRASTARVDIEAAWPEFVDDGPGAADPTRPDPNVAAGWLNQPAKSAIAVSMPIAEIPQFGQPDQLFLQEAPAPGPRHEFGDTKHRDVTYTPRAFSRFDDFFRVTAPVTFPNNDVVTLDNRGVVAGSVRLTAVVNGSTISYVEGRDFTVLDPGVTGAVQRLRDDNNVVLVPDNVTASWVPRPNDRVPAQPVQTKIFASARPAAPVIEYAIPTFGWQGSGSGGSQSRTRQGNSVRVYLRRPWWSSGGGELLGVLLAPGGNGQQPLDDETALLATQWGIDPIHVGAKTVDVPDASMFPRAVRTMTGLQVPENPPISLVAAGHAVDFDPARDLWFCDIDVAPGGWMPFVRLALARFQPDAIANQQLSSVVLADFVQLAADRTAVVTPGPKARQYNVQLSGPGYAATGNGGADPLGPKATVRVQRRRPGFAPSDPLAWTDVSTKVLTRQLVGNLNVVYSGTVTVTVATLAAGARLLFEEFEQVRTDGGAATTPTFGDRPVYADALVLS